MKYTLTPSQKKAFDRISRYDSPVNIVYGDTCSGKTFLACVCAIDAVERLRQDVLIIGKTYMHIRSCLAAEFDRLAHDAHDDNNMWRPHYIPHFRFFHAPTGKTVTFYPEAALKVQEPRWSSIRSGNIIIVDCDLGREAMFNVINNKLGAKVVFFTRGMAADRLRRKELMDAGIISAEYSLHLDELEVAGDVREQFNPCAVFIPLDTTASTSHPKKGPAK